jgi:hypothetical protein
MDEFRRRVIKFLEKEFKTYQALSLFLSKKGIEEQCEWERKKSLSVPRLIKRK